MVVWRAGGGHIFCFRNLARKVCVSWALSLVECVAVWVLMLTHIQAPHTDVLKTHESQSFSANLLGSKIIFTENLPFK